MRPSSVIMNTQEELPAFFGPVSGYTWEVQVVLAGDVEQTPVIPVELRGPVEILGFFPSVTLEGDDPTGSILTNAVPRRPTTDDVVVTVDINQEDRLTNRLETTQVEPAARSFVTLAALSVEVPRLHRVQLLSARPDVHLQFRWGVPHLDAEVTVYHDALIKLAFYCRYLPQEMGREFR